MLAPAVSFFTGDNSKKVKYKSGKDSLKVDIVTVGVMTVINASLLSPQSPHSPHYHPHSHLPAPPRLHHFPHRPRPLRGEDGNKVISVQMIRAIVESNWTRMLHIFRCSFSIMM